MRERQVVELGEEEHSNAVEADRERARAAEMHESDDGRQNARQEPEQPQHVEERDGDAPAARRPAPLANGGDGDLAQHRIAHFAKHSASDHDRGEKQRHPIAASHGVDAVDDGLLEGDERTLGVGARVAHCVCRRDVSRAQVGARARKCEQCERCAHFYGRGVALVLLSRC